jgi:hypothetical protein
VIARILPFLSIRRGQSWYPGQLRARRCPSCPTTQAILIDTEKGRTDMAETTPESLADVNADLSTRVTH